MSGVATEVLQNEFEDHLSPRDFARISDLVEGEVGIRLPPAKRSMAEGRLRRRVRAVGAESFHHYCVWLFDHGGLKLELPHLIDTVTTNKTDFFREREHYDYLEQIIVPDLLKKRGEYQPLIKIWSAASSNGAEAFSAAMVLADMIRTSHQFSYRILGTDVSTEVLAQARRAVFPADMIGPVPWEMQSRYVMHSKRPGLRPEVRIVPELRNHVGFNYLNLMDETYPIDRDVDVIFLRNVLIYFEKPVQQAVIERVAGHLRPGGFLLLGHSESMIGTRFPISQVAPATYQRL